MKLKTSASFFAGTVLARLSGRNIPLSAIVNLTDKCNMTCVYCYASYYKRRKREMTTTQVCSLLKDLKTSGCRRVSLAGGEPLLRNDLDVIIECVKELGLICTVNSNGLLVPRKIDLMKKADILCLSFDGDQASHDVYRGQGSYRAVMAAIEAARNKGIEVLTNTVLHRFNLDQVDSIIATARKMGFKCLFNVSISLLSGKGTSSFKAEERRLREALQHIKDLKKGGAPVLTSTAALDYCRAWPNYDEEFIVGSLPQFSYIPCMAGRYFITVDTNGEVFPCTHLMNGRFQPLNAGEVGVKEAVDNACNHTCRACYHIGHTEFNMLFSLHPRSVTNMILEQLK